MTSLQKEHTLSPEEFALLRQYIEAESGISLADDKQYLVENRLKRLLSDLACASYHDLYQKAMTDQRGLVRQRIIDAITTNETLWFRDKGPYVVLEEKFLPAAVERIRKGTPRLRIWSAACSTGQEPYSIAIVIHNFLAKLGDSAITPQHFQIVATDISSEALGAARLGAYDRFNMERGMDPENTTRYFKQNQQYWIIDPKLKRMIEYREFNLLKDFAPLGNFDLVFCRNVAIYFSHQTKIEIFEKIHRLLNPNGILLLGSTESMTFYTRAFAARDHKSFVYYQAAVS